MGLLAENKSRTRINKDPNNTKWTRDTKTFGQKILRAQGWQPGQFLGVQNAAHSELHTAANASYIRVALKDDMKGLGFNRAKEDEVTGLDVFSDLLSRLNGKSEASVESDQQARLVVKTNRYVEAKWGPMRFVRGGLLVGDKEQEVAESTESTDSTPEAESSETTSRKSKKRRAADLDESDNESNAEKKEKRRRKEEKKAKKLLRLAAEAEESNASPDEAGSSKKKSKKDKLKSRSNSDGDDKTESKKSKKEKKDKKKRRKEGAEASEADSAIASIPTSAAGTGTSTPMGTGTGTSTPRGSRNFVRSRFIAQKKQAVLDTKALNQIFMLKT